MGRAERARFSNARKLARRASRAQRSAHRAIYRNKKALLKFKFRTFYALKKLARSAKKMMAAKAKKAPLAKAAHLNKRWAQAQAAEARRNKRAKKRYGRVVKALKKRNKISIMKFNARVAHGKAYFA